MLVQKVRIRMESTNLNYNQFFQLYAHQQNSCWCLILHFRTFVFWMIHTFDVDPFFLTQLPRCSTETVSCCSFSFLSYLLIFITFNADMFLSLDSQLVYHHYLHLSLFIQMFQWIESILNSSFSIAVDVNISPPGGTQTPKS